MKKELIDFLNEHDLFQFKLDAGSEYMVRDALDEFFDKYQPERSKREDLVYKEPNFEKMRIENPCLYSKYEASKNALGCGALNTVEIQ